ncbi:hypothetical protein J6500_17915 [Bradyrhizobium sp. WSM 1704]|uniref:hypothetical protein n=1 Tax=Bradyrhizobium semiaridum TaxID=2821404 RepID=UPI001CE34030|nr:hypothetical protein [Bradyrhizobium semiaridum]MCA6123759.1 hypothetical protein [Bradyrhizobium semiaridum]
MSNRSAKFASALVASILAGANFSAVAQNAATTAQAKSADKTADNCQSAPKGAAPAGSHWYYHLDRATKTKCWYLGEAKNKAAKTVTAQQQAAPAPDATAADTAPAQAQAQPQQPLPQQSQPAMSKAVADARAEWPSPQAPASPAPTDANQSGSAAAAQAPASADGAARWLDSTSMARANGTRYATPQPAPVAQTDAPPPQQAAPAPAPVPAAAVEAAPAEKPSASTQMLLVVMVGALALAGLVSALVVKLTRRRTPAYDVRDEQRAPWDSIHFERAPPPAQVSLQRPIRLSELPPRPAEPPVPRRESVARDLDQTAEDSRQIAAMLQRLARSAAN